MVDWKPVASLNTLQTRAEILAKIRRFFASKNVLEVETPLLSRSTATDVYIQSLEVVAAKEKFYLQTSPEFAMKRLLGSGVGPIYQICKAFRQGEVSKSHRPEFTMLEWYQPGYSMLDLMVEVEQLVDDLLSCGAIPRLSYRALFQEYLGIDPHAISLEALESLALSKMEISSEKLSRTDYLQLLLGNNIEALMPSNCFVYDFPIDQAALAVIENDQYDVPVAKRFELFFGGMELANGYFELTDEKEQRLRFETDLQARKKLQLADYPIDEKLLAALKHGVPNCSGVALGIDRLIMLAVGSADIRDVISFS